MPGGRYDLIVSNKKEDVMVIYLIRPILVSFIKRILFISI